MGTEGKSLLTRFHLFKAASRWQHLSQPVGLYALKHSFSKGTYATVFRLRGQGGNKDKVAAVCLD